MTTTVQVRDETRRLLERLKRQMGVPSYDDVIRKLARSKAGVPDSLFGACKGSRRFVREKEAEHAF
jgi:predicted CopG family antitoxin